MTPKAKKYDPKYAKELIKIAKGDLGSAKDLQSGKQGRPENVLYLTQQSIEKCLKAVLCILEKPVLHTHDLEALINLLPKNTLPQDWNELLSLTEYATVRRYEEGYEILTDEDLRNAIQLGERIIKWAEKLIK